MTDSKAGLEEPDFDLRDAKLMDQRDIVFAWERSTFPFPKLAHELESGIAIENTCVITYLTADKTTATERARSILCSCGARKFISGTFRLPGGAVKPLRTASIPADVLTNLRAKKADKDFLFQTDDIAKFLMDRLLLLGEAPNGLVVFSGSTNAGKSDTSKAFLLRLLNGTRNPTKWPHLVTFEDPLEPWPVIYNQESVPLDPLSAQSIGLSFTPRQASAHKHGIMDVSSLLHARSNLLRQTASAFYIGEIRDDDDWRHALFLAGTGNLVVTTTHAGSLTETVQRILAAANVRTEAQRGFVASKVRAVINLEATSLEVAGKRKSVLMAACWLNSTEAVASLVSDGLSSIISNGHFVIGKGAFAKNCPIDKNACDDDEIWRKAAIQYGLLADVLKM